MSPPLVVLTSVVVLLMCESAGGVAPTGLQELTALDVVLVDLQGVLETHSRTDALVRLTDPLGSVWNASGSEEANNLERVGRHGHFR